MAGNHRTARDPVALLNELEREPWRFNFLQTLRELECCFPEHPRVASSAKAADQPIRFGQAASMIFAPADSPSCSAATPAASPCYWCIFSASSAQTGRCRCT